ncbi:MAG: primosomal protein N', partial [Burkholderiaceae bacterium]
MAQLGAAVFDYTVPVEHAAQLRPGSWVVVPWGRARRIGIVVALSSQAEVEVERIRPLREPLADAPVLPAAWLNLVGFAADYYHRGLGEVALPAIPKLLRTPPPARARGSVFARARQRFTA